MLLRPEVGAVPVFRYGDTLPLKPGNKQCCVKKRHACRWLRATGAADAADKATHCINIGDWSGASG